MICAPLPYSDELLSCAVTRCCRWHCVPMKRLAALCLGNSQLRPHLLAVRPVSLLARLFDVTAEHLLWNHTTFPYATAYCSPAVYDAAFAAAVNWAAPYASLLAVMQNATFGVSRRRLCPECCVAEMATFGFTYWHRSHHLPGVLLCSKHKCPLTETDLPATNSLATIYTLPHEAKRVREVTRSATQSLLHLADLSTALLTRSPGTSSPRDAGFYRSLAVKEDWLSEGRQVSEHALTEAVRRTFAASHLRAMSVPVDSRQGWPALLFRRGTSFNSPPLRHLVLQTTLELAPRKSGELDHVSTGPTGTAPAAVDAFYAPRARDVLAQALRRREKLTTEQFLRRSGALGPYRHLGANLPQLRAVVRAFRSSPASVKPLRPDARLYRGTKHRNPRSHSAHAGGQK